MTKNVLLAALWLVLLPAGFAQGFYVGASLGTPLSVPTGAAESVSIGAQLGVDIVSVAGVRLFAEGNPVGNGLEQASADAIFRFYLPYTYNSFYAGAGADALFGRTPTTTDALLSPTFVVHALGGFEYRLGTFGLFAETLPSYVLGSDFSELGSYYLRLRGGVNVHF